MLSILIPVYNFNITELVKELHKQGLECGHKFEIIVADDGSSIDNKIKNRDISNLQFVNYIEFEKNIGRSRIRNKLFYLSRYDYVLFIDCDAKIPSSEYLKKYLENCNNAVVCGGTCYESDYIPPQNSLRWNYGILREQRSAIVRNKNAYHSFTTFNFMIPRKVFEQICFDESINRYGHEDTLFGYHLKKRHIPIKHIDNPLIHLGLDENYDFVFKTKQSIKNLYLIVENNNSIKSDFYKDIKVLYILNILKKINCTGIISLLYKGLHKKIENNLTSTSPKLYLLDALKIGYLCTLVK